MKNLIRLTREGALLSEEAAAKIAEFERQKKKIEALENELRAELLFEMQERGIIKAASKDLTITYIAEGMRETFDGRTFRKENPDMYDKYVKLAPVKASVRIKLNDN